jgi:hypothetical protein
MASSANSQQQQKRYKQIIIGAKAGGISESQRKMAAKNGGMASASESQYAWHQAAYGEITQHQWHKTVGCEIK